MKWLKRLLWRPKPAPEPPSYWQKAETVRLVWDFGDEGEESTFTVFAPTAEEAEGWARAASVTGKHAQINASLPSHQPRVKDPLP